MTELDNMSMNDVERAVEVLDAWELARERMDQRRIRELEGKKR